MVERVYLVGAGVIAGTHAAAARRLPGDPALFVADPDEAARARFLDAHPRATAFDDAGQMLASAPAEPSDVVVVATPPFAHATLVHEALSSGRNVLCEKPLALSASEARELSDFAERARLLLGCCSCRFLGLPTSRRARALLSRGALGRPYHVTFVNRFQRRRSGIEYQPDSTWFVDSSKSGGGVLMDWGPYDFAALDELLAPVRVDIKTAWHEAPETAASLPDGTVNDVEQHVAASLVYHTRAGESIPVTYERAACTHGGERSIVELEGASGAVAWDWLMLRHDGSVTIATDDGGAVHVVTESYPVAGEIDFLDKPLLYFAERLAGLESPIKVNRDAVFVFSCLRAVYDCARTGRPQTVTREVE